MADCMNDTAAPQLALGYTAKPVIFDDLPGWGIQDFKQVFATFLASARPIISSEPSVRPARATDKNLKTVCEQAVLRVPANSAHDIQAFFEMHFTPYTVKPDNSDGFITAYYEPDIEGSRVQTLEFNVPVLGRPQGLVSIAVGDGGHEFSPSLVAARQVMRNGENHLEALPDRASIEDGALNNERLELVWFRDRIELFMMQVQGSGRVKFSDSTSQRLTYAGRNGYPYTSIGKAIVAEGHMNLETMTLASLKAWLRAHPADAKRIMRLNRSYIFFALADIPVQLGPIGGMGVSLTPHYSIAIDRNIWPYGLPFFVAALLPDGKGGQLPVTHLMIGQDTGSAIVGAARADYFMGSGDEAGARAGLVRHKMSFTVLWPKS